jgi:arylsulfatase A-like enzyme
MKLSLNKSILILISIFFCTACKSQVVSSEKPNIVLIYADDLGIGLLGIEGQKIIKTPNIDKLAFDGIRFKQAYSNMLCAPARASLISGLHDSHQNGFEITRGGAYKKATKSNLDSIENNINKKLHSIPKDQIFLGNVAQKMGYKTAQIGKLEWGFSTTDKQMKRHGWDYYFGYLDHERAHGFYPPFLFENGEIINIEGNSLLNSGKSIEHETAETFKERWNMEGKKAYSENIFIEKALNFIDTNKENPFFLYYPTQLPHGPVSIPKVHPDFINDARLTQIEKEYASMVKLLDDHVGKILSKLKEHHLDENTIVIFAADNGHEIYYSKKDRITKPYTNIQTGERFDNYQRKYYSELSGDIFNGNGGRAGLKRSNLEGGIHVPLIIKWPKKIKKGRTSKQLIANYDILPTIAEITGFNEEFKTDGISFYKELIEDKNQKKHEFVIYSSYTGPTLITNDGWKLRTFLKKKLQVFELYYLPNDFREEKNVSKEFPDKFEALKSKLLTACDGDFKNGIY